MNNQSHNELSKQDKRFIDNYLSLPDEHRKCMQLIGKAMVSGILTEEDSHFFIHFMIEHAK